MGAEVDRMTLWMINPPTCENLPHGWADMQGIGQRHNCAIKRIVPRRAVRKQQELIVEGQ